MSFESAKKIIKHAKVNKSNKVNLYSEGLTDNDLIGLIPEIEDLENLTWLALSYNNLSTGDYLKSLTNLIRVDLRNNNLTDVDFLKGLTNLTSLDLSANSLSNCNSIKGLTNLTSLDLSFNAIEDIDWLRWLINLTKLDLSGNNLSNGDFLKDLKKIEELTLDYNDFASVQFLKELNKLVNLGLNKNEKLPNFGLDLTKRLRRKEIETIVNFYEDLEKQGKEYIYEAKVLIIGQPRSGKTTLFRKLITPDYQPREATDEEKRSTLGINIETFPFKIKSDSGVDSEFKAYLWDFGGQDIQYILHQYFLTERSLYIFLYDVASEDEKTNYWFEIIATLGKDCPVLVVLNYNQIEKSRASNFSIDTYRKEFADKIKDIFERKVDFAVNDGDWEDLYQTIKIKVSSLEHIGKDFLPQKTVEIRNLLGELDKPIINLDDYYDICKENQIEEAEANTILDRLHEFGVALWYKHDDNLRDKVILKPNWVIDALYVVLKDDLIKENNGRFCSEWVFKLWKEYKQKDKVFLLSLMQKGVFSTAYKLQNTDNWYIVPALLSEDEPVYKFDEENLIQIYYEYNFMPDGIISRLIVELNEKIHSQEDRQIIWKKGAFFESKNSIAEVVQSIRDRKITIKVSGVNQYANRDLLFDIRKEINKIHSQIFKNRLSVYELVPCPCAICKERRKDFEKLSPEAIRNLTEEEKKALETDSFNLTDLVNRLGNSSKKTIECHKSGEDINVPRLLGEIYVETKSRGGEFMGGDNYYFNAPTQFNKNIKDNATANQYNYPDNDEIENKLGTIINTFEEKLNNIISKQNEPELSQEQFLSDLVHEIQIMHNEMMSIIGMAFEKLDANEQERYKSLKHKPDWESNLTLTVPLLDKIGIKIESKTKLETLISKAKAKIDKLRGKDSQTESLKTDAPTHLLEK